MGVPCLSRWFRLRQAIRAGEHEIIDIMWPLAHHWFRATNKTNYSCMSVYVTFIRYGMKPELATLWTAMRTAASLESWPTSFSGRL